MLCHSYKQEIKLDPALIFVGLRMSCNREKSMYHQQQLFVYGLKERVESIVASPLLCHNSLTCGLLWYEHQMLFQSPICIWPHQFGVYFLPLLLNHLKWGKVVHHMSDWIWIHTTCQLVFHLIQDVSFSDKLEHVLELYKPVRWEIQGDNFQRLFCLLS